MEVDRVMDARRAAGSPLYPVCTGLDSTRTGCRRQATPEQRPSEPLTQTDGPSAPFRPAERA